MRTAFKAGAVVLGGTLVLVAVLAVAVVQWSVQWNAEPRSTYHGTYWFTLKDATPAEHERAVARAQEYCDKQVQVAHISEDDMLGPGRLLFSCR